MKNTIVRILMVTVALGSAAVAASAQTLVGKVNFGFQAGPTAMPAGNYSLSRLETLSGSPLYKVAGSSGGYVFLGGSPEQVIGGEQPYLAFTCTGEKCVLTKFSTGAVRNTIPHPKSSHDLEARTIEVRLGRMAD